MPSNGSHDLPWHSLSEEAVRTRLSLAPAGGLAAPEAARRLAQYGPNRLTEGRPIRWYQVFLRQFTDLLILVLAVAAAVSLALGETVDAITIAAILLLNGILGFVQEWRAENAIRALQGMLTPRCRAIRAGQLLELDVDRLVPGDLVLLEAGNRVPADLRIVESVNLRLDEASLTGESAPVGKEVEPLAPGATLAQRRNMAWMGTIVTNGRGEGLVVATGMRTEFGRIARLTGEIRRKPTDLQVKLAGLAKMLALLSVTISALVTILGILTGKDPFQMLLEGVSLAVAAVPEGLPAVVTITLALGIRTMVRRKALLRQLQAAETLGATTVICTDKTGTLTKNQMTVVSIWTPDGSYEVTGSGYSPEGHFLRDGAPIRPEPGDALDLLLATGAACNHARVVKEGIGWAALGEPTEASLLVAATKAGLAGKPKGRPVTEFSFDSGRKRMSVVVETGGRKVSHVKGAPEVLLERCTSYRSRGIDAALNGGKKAEIAAAFTRMAQRGLRTLALARKELPSGAGVTEEEAETGLTLLGVVGIIDPPREEVPDAVRSARSAGIEVVMVTGDSPATALAVARHVGLRADRAITGAEIDRMDDGALREAFSQGSVFARTVPEHKLRIVRLFQERGQVVAMTGDGVNDAPALKQADVGIAMGLRGTDVAKSAAAMVLTDDNFASIVGAVEEGRRQYANIQKFVRYLLSSNAGEILAIFANILTRGPLILLPVQILWMNLVTDGMTAVALGLEKAEKDLMRRPPRRPGEAILDRGGLFMIAFLGGYIGIAALWLFQAALRAGGDDHAWRVANTMAFTGIVVFEKMNVLNFRSLTAPLPTVGFFSNPWLLLALLVTLGLQVGAVHLPTLQSALGTVPLGPRDWGVIVAWALPLFFVTEFVKWVRARKAADPGRKK